MGRPQSEGGITPPGSRRGGSGWKGALMTPAGDTDPVSGSELPEPSVVRALNGLARRITDAVSFLDVGIAGRDSPLPWSCAEILAAQDAGDDPTESWRATVSLSHEGMYGMPAPDRVAAAFVLQWYLGLVAQPLAFAAVLGDWALDASADGMRFDLSDDDGYPVAVTLAPGMAVQVADPQTRLDLARERYTAHARAFEAGYRPPVKMGSAQRSGMVHDAWTMALESALSAAGEPVTRSWRRSCCFIFALPGAAACALCPRRRHEEADRPSS